MGVNAHFIYWQAMATAPIDRDLKVACDKSGNSRDHVITLQVMELHAHDTVCPRLLSIAKHFFFFFFAPPHCRSIVRSYCQKCVVILQGACMYIPVIKSNHDNLSEGLYPQLLASCT